MKSLQLEIHFSSGNTVLCDKVIIADSIKLAIDESSGTLTQEQARVKVFQETHHFLSLVKQIKKLDTLTVMSGSCELTLNPDKIDYIKIIKE